jgi:hypothetical protein
MKKLIPPLSICFLIIFTTITKNSTKEIEKKIYDTEENLRVLKNKYEMVLLEFNYLSSPRKLLEYQSKYFEKELSEIDIKNLKKITLKENKLKIEEFIDSAKNERNK